VRTLGCIAALVTMGVVGCAPRHGTIGAILAQSPDGSLTIRDAPEGLAAEDAGLQPGDQILLIDGRDVRSMDPATVHQHLSGAIGEPVKLTVLRGDEVIRVTVRRSPAERYRGEETLSDASTVR
jgi:C-terminal processing protease CtpA/Prc